MNNSGIQNINVLNTNFLYIQGVAVDFQGSNAYLQGEIDAIEQQLVGIDNIVSRIDFNQPTPLVGDLVITEENKNSVLLTAIQNINTQIAKLNQFDLTGLPPPQTCIITTATTNQALKGLIDTNTGDIATINQAITNINTKIAHWNNFTFGGDSMCGVNDGTGFAVALSNSASGNGIFVYPNTTSVTEQIKLECAQDKEIFIRGGDAVKIYGATNGTIAERNRVEIGDSSDIIALGVNSTATLFPEIEIGVDGTALIQLDSSTTLKGDVYFSNQVASTGIYNVAPYTPVMVADTNPGLDFGNCNKFTTDPYFSGLDVVSTAPLAVAPITLSALSGVIALTALAGGVTVTTGVGACAFQCGAGGFSVATGAGVMNLATGAGTIQMSTLSGNITIGAGKGSGGSSGNTILNSINRIDLNPDVETDIYKTAFIEFNENASAPPTTANRLYQQANQLYFDGAQISGGGGAFVPLAGNATMTGSLSLNYDAGANSQLNIINTNTVAGTGGAINIRNDSAGAGSIGERCGKIDFSGRDSLSAGGRTYSAIQAYINDPTAGAIDGRLSAFVASNNTLSEMFRLVSTSTSVRQANIGATNTIIGATAIGASTTDTLRVQGSTSITTTLDVPLIQNAPNIYPATSTTLVDSAVRKYQPERFYRLIDYPTPLSAPTTDGEKVIILNNTGSPAGGIDQIVQASNFPQVNGVSVSQIIQMKYVEASTYTPAMNVITASYPDNTISVFVQPDTGATPLALTHIGRFTATSGAVLVNDFIVRSKPYSSRLYFGGTFETYQIPLPWGVSAVQCNNFSGQVVITWGGSSPNFTISNVNVNAMPSTATTSEGVWSNVIGLNADITTVIDVTGTSNFPQPNATFDSIVIGGDFTAVGAPGATQRALKRLAYYDNFNASGTSTTLYNQPTIQNFINFASDTQVLGTFTPATTGNYTNFSASCQLGYYTPQPFTPPTATCVIQLRNSLGAVLASSGQLNISSAVPITESLSPEFQLVSGQTYSVVVFCSNFNDFPLGSLSSYGIISPPQPFLTFTAVLINGVIGWKSFDTDYSNPVGADAKIRGGALFSSGYLGFAYDGSTLTAPGAVVVTSNRVFKVYYMSGTSTFSNFGDDDLIEPLASQTWVGNVNTVTGGNPVLAFGAGNAIAYGEIYLNRGLATNTNSPGVSYRPTNVDPYQMTDVLVLTDSGLGANQLLPQFSSQASYATYRDDTKYPNTFWIARGNEIQTATLPFSGGIPNYQGVSLPGGVQIPAIGFGGYSDEVGYQGLVIYATPTNAYLYKGSLAGELVIELSGCVVRCANNIYAQNKLTFPAEQDGTSIYLVGDTSIVNPYGKPSWWALSQDGGIYYDNTLVNNNNQGVTSLATAGSGIAVSSPTGAVTISNTGVTSIVAGTNISISGATGAVTINATIPSPATTNGMIRFAFFGYPGVLPNQYGVLVNNNPGFTSGNPYAFDFANIVYQNGIAVSGNWTQGNGGIIWNGANPINIQGQICVDLSLYQQDNQGNYNLMRVQDFNNTVINHIAFGHKVQVLTSAGSNLNNSSSVFQMNMNQSNDNYYGTVTPFMRSLSGTLSFNTQMLPGQLLRVSCLGNTAWNGAGIAGTYQVLFEASSQASGYGNAGGITLTINEMPFS